MSTNGLVGCKAGRVRRLMARDNQEANRDETFPVQRLEVDFPCTQPISLIPVRREVREEVYNRAHGAMVIREGVADAIRLSVQCVPGWQKVLWAWLDVAAKCDAYVCRRKEPAGVVDWAKSNKEIVKKLTFNPVLSHPKPRRGKKRVKHGPRKGAYATPQQQQYSPPKIEYPLRSDTQIPPLTRSKDCHAALS